MEPQMQPRHPLTREQIDRAMDGMKAGTTYVVQRMYVDGELVLDRRSPDPRRHRRRLLKRLAELR